MFSSLAIPTSRFVVISRFLMEQLGVSEEQFQILTEMELAEFTVQIHCRQYVLLVRLA